MTVEPGSCRSAGRRLVRRSRFPLLAAAALLSGLATAQVDTAGEYLKRMDVDGDGRVSLDEYLAWMSYAFDQRDLDHDGVLSPAELPGGRGKPVTRTQYRDNLIARFHRQDADGDGYLSARELLAPPR